MHVVSDSHSPPPLLVQGALLSIPELAPFRLTRDLVDGCGVLGTEGPLRASCEACLRVLRRSQRALLAVTGVFLHDPLFKWEDLRRVSHAMGHWGSGWCHGLVRERGSTACRR